MCQALAAASKLTTLANELVSEGGSESGEAAPLLSSQELRRFNTLLLRKAWERRDDLRIVTRRFAAKLLEQTAQRVLSPRTNGN